ncbi:MAG TPA: TolC family protein [bacterium]|nr:TolC family protein [bacterium]HQL60666.1 TolC family protein [bacterium]
MRNLVRICIGALLWMGTPDALHSQPEAPAPTAESAVPPAQETPTPEPTPPPDLILTLGDAVSMALQNNPDLRQARTSLEAADAEFDLSRSPYRSLVDLNQTASARFIGVHEIAGRTVFNPTRSAQEGQAVYDRFGSHDYREDDHQQVDFTQNITRTFRNGHRLQFQTTQHLYQDSLAYYDDDPDRSSDFQSNARLSYTVPFNSREKRRIHRDLENADLAHQQSQYALVTEEENLIYRVNIAYWNLKYSEEDLAIQRDYLSQARKTYEFYQIQNEYGFVSDFDVKQSRVAMRKIEAGLLAGEAGVKDDYEALNLLLGTPINYRIQLTDPLEVSKSEKPAQEYIDLALSTNLNLETIRLNLKQNENDLAVTRLGQQPTVELVNSYQRDDGGDNMANFQFQVLWPFGDGGATRARVRASESRLEEQRIRLWEEERALRQQVIQVLRQIETAKEQLKINEENVRLAREALDIADFKFENGQIGFRDLQDAQIDLANSRVSCAGTIRTLNVSYAALESLIHEH